jgi:hypothetical protein
VKLWQFKESARDRIQVSRRRSSLGSPLWSGFVASAFRRIWRARDTGGLAAWGDCRCREP